VQRKYSLLKKHSKIIRTSLSPQIVSNTSLLQVYKVQLPELTTGEKISLVISTAYVDCLTPYPAIVAQDGKQYLLYHGEKYTPSLYTTLKQKTKIKYSTAVLDRADIDCAEKLSRIHMETQTSMVNLIPRNQALSLLTDPMMCGNPRLRSSKSKSISSLLSQLRMSSSWNGISKCPTGVTMSPLKSNMFSVTTPPGPLTHQPVLILD
jgi:hypothetical protein